MTDQPNQLVDAAKVGGSAHALDHSNAGQHGEPAECSQHPDGGLAAATTQNGAAGDGLQANGLNPPNEAVATPAHAATVAPLEVPNNVAYTDHAGTGVVYQSAAAADSNVVIVEAAAHQKFATADSAAVIGAANHITSDMNDPDKNGIRSVNRGTNEVGTHDVLPSFVPAANMATMQPRTFDLIRPELEYAAAVAHVTTNAGAVAHSAESNSGSKSGAVVDSGLTKGRIPTPRNAAHVSSNVGAGSLQSGGALIIHKAADAADVLASKAAMEPAATAANMTNIVGAAAHSAASGSAAASGPKKGSISAPASATPITAANVNESLTDIPTSEDLSNNQSCDVETDPETASSDETPPPNPYKAFKHRTARQDWPSCAEIAAKITAANVNESLTDIPTSEDLSNNQSCDVETDPETASSDETPPPNPYKAFKHRTARQDWPSCAEIAAVHKKYNAYKLRSRKKAAKSSKFS
ncbi:uncharacterized protein LOC109794087 [Cajanus cajan]|uniref:uncharacterized protein LOC109794087 n=1 Tax=Cajanus cajan TaxID=3821 RepID=UPI00098DB90E|nr:uncharacterized protein LOC109794087 [Cajanus cajan]